MRLAVEVKVPQGVRTLLAEFPRVSLSELDDRAALLRRIDNKYAVPPEAFAQLADRLREDHQVLEIDGRREFAYRTTYFETPDLRCFVDHVEGRVPRFKARTRIYEDTGACVFEVKLKRSDDEMDKHQLDYPVNESQRLTDSARTCVAQALGAAGLRPPDELHPRLQTSFHRVTFAPRTGSGRLTCDFGVRLANVDGRAVHLRRDLVLVETKTESGESSADSVLTQLGVESISLSKYRVGIGLVGDAHLDGVQPGSDLFT